MGKAAGEEEIPAVALGAAPVSAATAGNAALVLAVVAIASLPWSLLATTAVEEVKFCEATEDGTPCCGSDGDVWGGTVDDMKGFEVEENWIPP